MTLLTVSHSDDNQAHAQAGPAFLGSGTPSTSSIIWADAPVPARDHTGSLRLLRYADLKLFLHGHFLSLGASVVRCSLLDSHRKRRNLTVC